ncbi:MAG: hypothetical protein OSB10_11650, partial [Planctomycetota bacterium]|nr:hypothetical protein [Planctomycetota bacterium]
LENGALVRASLVFGLSRSTNREVSCTAFGLMFLVAFPARSDTHDRQGVVLDAAEHSASVGKELIAEKGEHHQNHQRVTLERPGKSCPTAGG